MNYEAEDLYLIKMTDLARSHRDIVSKGLDELQKARDTYDKAIDKYNRIVYQKRIELQKAEKDRLNKMIRFEVTALNPDKHTIISFGMGWDYAELIAHKFITIPYEELLHILFKDNLYNTERLRITLYNRERDTR